MGEKYELRKTILFNRVRLTLIALVLVSGFQKMKRVATVDNEKITKDELYDFLVQADGQEALDVIIEEK